MSESKGPRGATPAQVRRFLAAAGYEGTPRGSRRGVRRSGRRGRKPIRHWDAFLTANSGWGQAELLLTRVRYVGPQPFSVVNANLDRAPIDLTMRWRYAGIVPLQPSDDFRHVRLRKEHLHHGRYEV